MIFLILSLTVHGMIIALCPTIERTQLPQPGGQAITVSLLVLESKQAVQQNDAAHKNSDGKAIQTSPAPAKPEQPPLPVARKVTPAVRQTAQMKPIPARTSLEEPQAPPVSARNKTNSVATQPDSVARHSQRLEVVLRKAFNAHFYYPRLAVRRGWQGQVRLGLRIEANGHLSRIRILQGSGYELLDKAAIKSLNKLEMLPTAITLLNGHSMDLILPVKYQLL
ncbi:energy transducer TonB [Sulfuriflexus mobilis]|uniref:energy transducer TonB n=1 Tax=Sulfuriflexus mobilis TaxID=1811807 RepID=UPI0015586904|nr:TonB family protein [Sulfuriflexus mobilis]